MASVADLVSQMVSLEWMQHQRQRKVGGDRLVREGLGHAQFMFDLVFLGWRHGAYSYTS